MRSSPLVVALVLVACADSGGSEGDASSGSGVGTSSAADSSSTSGGTTSAAESSGGDEIRYDLGDEDSGMYLLALATPLDSGLPLQFFATIAVEQAVLTMTLQPLSLDQGSMTAPRQPVGAVLEPTIDFMTPAFSAQLDDAMIPGAANPISGDDIAGAITLVGSLAGAGTPCGQAEGMLTAPAAMDLSGSTWAATPVSSIDDLPESFASSCPGR
ncbi:MAG TPA: hypothetical protein VFG69_01055 [Nannocystaceae bacterium]|nr:hypothetical protein [Nannocystaceae bacterium]